MSYSVIIVCSDGNVILSEIKKDEISDFFKKERNMFSGKISELSPMVTKKIIAGVGQVNNLGFVELDKVESLAEKKQRADVLQLIKILRIEYLCQYIIGK